MVRTASLLMAMTIACWILLRCYQSFVLLCCFDRQLVSCTVSYRWREGIIENSEAFLASQKRRANRCCCNMDTYISNAIMHNLLDGRINRYYRHDRQRFSDYGIAVCDIILTSYFLSRKRCAKQD